MTEQTATPVVIKKYPNRRLYDTEASKYITLEDLCVMVKKGVDFIVTDAKTGEDLTRSVLTQIIFEQESKGSNLLPVRFLRQIIGFYDDNLHKLVPPYLENVMDQFSKNQDKMRGYLGNMESFSPFKQWEQIGKQNMEIFEKMWGGFSPFGKKEE